MGSKVTDGQVQRGRAVERWLTGTVGLDADRARFIACNLADRSTPRVKRRALLNILQMRLDKEAALDLLAQLVRAGVLVAEPGGDPRDGGEAFAIRYDAVDGPAADGADGLDGGTPCFTSEAMASRAAELAKSPGKLERFAAELRALDAWLSASEGVEPARATLGQRSFEVFNDEKALNEHNAMTFVKFLRGAGILPDELRLTAFPEPPLEAFVPHGARDPIVVVENRDTYQTLRYVLSLDSRFDLFGQRVGGVVYGAGTQAGTEGLIDRTLEALGYRLPYVLYCGDIDRSGVSIVSLAREANRTQVRLARGMYKAMARKQRERTRRGLPVEEAARQSYPEHLDAISREVPLTARWLFLQTVRGNGRIPQEILTLEDYLERVR